ncbi:MAG TPA: chemotaxis protein CheB [Polyangiaceae bacterium]|jgi:two-component system CheB/CheR fusion protein
MKKTSPARAPRRRVVAEPVAIVGVGASAGGVEALQAFFERTPEHSGLAFVVVLHREPKNSGMLADILRRATKASVTEARDRAPLRPDCIHVVPADRDVIVSHGKLRLTEPASTDGRHLPIDAFFRSLADEYAERAVGVILSGMGSDGTLGLRAIKENAGAAFVQLPASAKFGPMPESAIEAGLADVVAPVDELANQIVAFARGRVKLAVTADGEAGVLDRIFAVLRAITGNDFSQYKKSTIVRRIERRMGLHQTATLGAYLQYLRENLNEAELLSKELLIGVTSFFRDPTAWRRLEKDVLPKLVRARAGGTVRAWVAGCSTGEEAYSLAIALREAIDKVQPARPVHVQVFATDLDRDAVERARAGAYPPNISADVSPARLRRFFVHDERGYRVAKEIREMVVFAPQNAIMDPPFTKLDLLSCRNVLIYLSADLQRKLIPLFHYSLSPDGILWLGNAETIGQFGNLFATEDSSSRIYRRLEPAEAPAIDFPASFTAAAVGESLTKPSKGPANIQSLVERVVLDHYAPAAVLTTEQGDILYVTGRTGRWLEPAMGKANWNVFAMTRDALRYELGAAFARATQQGAPVTAENIEVRSDGAPSAVDVTVEKLDEPAGLRGRMLVVLSASAAALKPQRTRTDGRHAIETMQHELRRAHEEGQNLREQMQSSGEKLKSANEELQSTNEELQSTNEELTTSKEELQSLNEELQTVNQELQSKVDELSRSNNDMSNLLNSTDIATLFLDSELRVRRFTRQTSKIMKLIPGDAGRPVTDMAMDLDYPDLAVDAREVLRSLVFCEKIVSARGGRWYSVRILPYRTLENVIDGVVITFTDASATKRLEASLREQAGQLRQLAESLPNLVFGCSADGTCDYVNAKWVEYTGIAEDEQLGYRWLEQIEERDRDALRRAWAEAIKRGTMLDVEARIHAVKGAARWFKIRAVPIIEDGGAVVRWYGSCTDVDDLKRAAAHG